MTYDEYIEACDRIKEKNDEYLDLFYKDLTAKGFTDNTIDRHLSNVAFYINTYLLHEEALTIWYGIIKIDDYLGNFFIRRCMWSTPNSIKTTAASFKKFYKCMMDHGIIESKDYEFLCQIIKNKMKKWQEDCAIFNDYDMYGSSDPFY